MTGDLEIAARNTTEMLVIGGGATVSGDRGVGASLGFNQISSTTFAGIRGTDNVADVNAGGTISVVAENENIIRAFAASAGIEAGGGFGTFGGGTLAINIISVDPAIFDGAGESPDHAIEASISNAGVTAGDTISVRAEDGSFIRAIGGALGVGLSSNAFGAALGWNQVNANIRARVEDDASVESTGGNVTVEAKSSEDSGAVNGKITAARPLAVRSARIHR